MPPAKALEVWETGFGLGQMLRDAEQGLGDGTTVRAHVGRAHWHSYWMGSGDEKRLDVRWQNPILVGRETPEKATVVKVK